jgi:LAO/AO transport system kinase
MTAEPVPDLAGLAAGGKRALARALSALETAPDDPAVARLLDAALAAPRGVGLGLTGPPGVGKSTLTNALIARLRARGRTVAVIAVDPSSRRSGGALLGDRTRIETDPEDAGVFVRSMAARRRLGGLADVTYPAMVLMRALYDLVLIETVGVGQSETEIADVADLVTFCVQPGSGDALQFMKAGVMEVPDVVLVTKGDLGAPAVRAAADVRGALSLAVEDRPPASVAIVSAATGEGVDAALDLIASRVDDALRSGALAARRAAQGRDWAESRLLESFGRVGLAALAPRLADAPTPFARVAELAARAAPAVHAVLKEV